MKFSTLARSIGLPLSRRQSSRTWEWDGRSLALMESSKRKRGMRSLIHDLCHWLTCTPRRRQRNEFGLGTTAGPALPARRYVSEAVAQREEEAVCVLSCLVERLMGFDEGGPDGPFIFYSMDQASVTTLTCWRLLEKRGVFEALERCFDREAVRLHSAWVLKACRRILAKPKDSH